MKKNQNAITLIALVVTIIVLLILVGVTISTLIGKNGILSTGVSARISTEQAQVLEQLRLEMYEKRLDIHNNLTEINYLKAKNIISGEITEVASLGKIATTNDAISVPSTCSESSNVYYLINVAKLVNHSSTGNGTWENGDVYYLLNGNLHYKTQNKETTFIGEVFEEKITGKIKWLYQENEENIEIIGMDLSEIKHNESVPYIESIFLEIDTLIIPSQINGKNVVKVGFSKSILPSSITDIDFLRNIFIRDVKNIIYGDTIEEIETSIFRFFDATEIHLPNNLKTIGREVFDTCNAQEIKIPPTVTSIGANAFDFDTTLNFENGKNDALEIPEYNFWGSRKILISGVEYTK